MLTDGDKAPAFDLEAASGSTASAAGLKGDAEKGTRVKLKELLAEGPVVLYFYPKDDTPGCTREAQGFTEAKRRLTTAGARVVGVSKDSIKSHCKFRDKYGINFPLLSDPDLAVHNAYGAYGEKVLYGKKTMGTIRSTFVIDPSGKIVRAWRGVKVDGHVDAVLDVLKGMKKPK
jgi:peroxiredoxin Q/BCP